MTPNYRKKKKIELHAAFKKPSPAHSFKGLRCNKEPLGHFHSISWYEAVIMIPADQTSCATIEPTHLFLFGHIRIHWPTLAPLITMDTRPDWNQTHGMPRPTSTWPQLDPDLTQQNHQELLLHSSKCSCNFRKPKTVTNRETKYFLSLLRIGLPLIFMCPTTWTSPSAKVESTRWNLKFVPSKVEAWLGTISWW